MDHGVDLAVEFRERAACPCELRDQCGVLGWYHSAFGEDLREALGDAGSLGRPPAREDRNQEDVSEAARHSGVRYSDQADCGTRWSR